MIGLPSYFLAYEVTFNLDYNATYVCVMVVIHY